MRSTCKKNPNPKDFVAILGKSEEQYIQRSGCCSDGMMSCKGLGKMMTGWGKQGRQYLHNVDWS